MKFITLLALILVLTPITASAQSIQTLLPNIVTFTSQSLIPFLFGVAFFIFVFNVFRYFILNGDNEDGRENAKNLAIYSVAAFVFLIIFWGIINLLSASTGIEDCKQSQSDYIGRHFVGPNQPGCI